MRIFRGAAVVAVVLSTVLACSPGARAAGGEGEFWVGYYVPDPSELDADYSFGIRGMRAYTESLSYGAEIGYVSTSGEAVSGSVTSKVDWESFFLDLVGDMALGTNPKIQPLFTFGMGVAFQSADSSVAGPIFSAQVDDLDSTSFTLQAGLGLKLSLGQSLFLRPAARLRWLTARSGDDLDVEYLVGIGHRW